MSNNVFLQGMREATVKWKQEAEKWFHKRAKEIMEQEINTGKSLGDIEEAILNSKNRPLVKWEYKIAQCNNLLVEEDLIGWLNSLGQEGWELIKYDSRWVDDDSLGLIDVKGIFKRKIQQG